MPPSIITYTAVPNIFMQTDASTDDCAFDFITTSLGIIKPTDINGDENSKAAWSSLRQRLQELNRESWEEEQMVRNKLFFAGRHGEGVHNLAKTRYGAEAWEAKWSKLDGDEHCVWGSDSALTAKGEEQARQVSMLWVKLRKEGVVFPEKFYSSPFRRCVHTARLTFGELALPRWGLMVIEGLKGRLVCVERKCLGRIENRESDEEMDVRVKGLLDDIFENDESQMISLTSHGGFIASILRVVGHRQFGVPTAGVIPILIRAAKTGNSNKNQKDELA